VSGLDHATQEHYYVEQLKIARDFNLPVLLHCRKSIDVLLKHLRQINSAAASRTPSTAVRNKRQNLSSWVQTRFAAPSHWPRANHLRRLAVDLRWNRSCWKRQPGHAPVWLARAAMRGRLPRIAAELAQLRGMTIEATAEATSRNANAVLAISP